MFKPNASQQLSFDDSFGALTERERRALERSWAKVFGDEVFPAIDEAPFAVLYAGGASRPNTPVNVIVGALIIKELLGLSDDQVVEDLMLDPRMQYALHTTSMAEQPLSDKTLSRFRRRCYEHERETGEDLVHGCVTALASRIASLMGVDGRLRRVDSTMIEASVRRLGRAELVWRCAEGALRALARSGAEPAQGPSHFLAEGSFNLVFHRARAGEEGRDALEAGLLAGAAEALALCERALPGAPETALLRRCLEEQTIAGEGGAPRLRTKEEFAAGSGALASPADPDATHREKRGVMHVGYVADLEESVGPAGSVVTDYTVEPNNVSDPAMLGARLEAEGRSEGRRRMVADGAYSGSELARLAAERNVDLVTTDLSGKPPDPFAAGFEFSQDGSALLRCPAGREPARQRLNAATGAVRASFPASACSSCPRLAECRPTVGKRAAWLWVSWKSKARAEAAARIGAEGFEDWRRLRAGVETVPSLLKRAYGAARLRVRGLAPVRVAVGFKVAALNVGKLLGFRRGGGRPRASACNRLVLEAYGAGA